MPTVVVTTDVLGDVVGQMLDGEALVEVLIPSGADAHSYQVSAREAAGLRDAAAIVVNGGEFESAMLDAVDGAEKDGIPVCVALDGADPIEAGHVHGPEDADSSDAGDHPDPHFFADPVRMAGAVDALSDCLMGAQPSLDTTAVSTNVENLVVELGRLDAELGEILSVVPEDRRVLVVNHDVLSYFAHRYEFDVVGAVLPGGVSHGSADAASMAELAHLLSERMIPVLFTDASASDSAARTIAAEAGGVDIVALHTESLGPADSGAETYAGMLRSNARAIAEALG